MPLMPLETRSFVRLPQKDLREQKLELDIISAFGPFHLVVSSRKRPEETVILSRQRSIHWKILADHGFAGGWHPVNYATPRIEAIQQGHIPSGGHLALAMPRIAVSGRCPTQR